MSPRRRELQPSLVGHYAGPMTRLLAYAADAALGTALFSFGAGALVWVTQLLSGDRFDVRHVGPWLGFPLLVVWGFLYFFVPLAMSGRTPGMALVGLEVVRRDGSSLDGGHAALRILVLPLSFLTLGIGLLGIVFGREHRALHDVLADTAVVYGWDARAARLRFLALGRK
ncbi:MAG TPA: RDD family protein [Acidimicrobiia bacterium]|nr:RDD family protein [Acidimicrobiia bacterium]